MIKKTACFLLTGSFFWISTVFAGMPDHPLVSQAMQARMPRVQYAMANDVQIKLTPDGKTYYLLWLPAGRSTDDLPPIVVSLHGHAAYAFEDFYVWHPFVKERGYGLMLIQWWLGKGEAINDYLLPNEIYRVIDQAFRELRVKPGTALLQGFSRGSANLYAVAAMDRNSGKHHFSLFVANAGEANPDYPPTHQIEQGRFGDKPFTGSHWVTFAGGQDPNPDRDGVPAMRRTAEWIRGQGGTVDLMIEDTDAGHGGFHQVPENVNAALDIFEQLLR